MKAPSAGSIRIRSLPVSSRLILLSGFGGLLLLMAFAEIDGFRAISAIEDTNDSVRDEFLIRTRLLDRIRSDLYVSGTDIRDYLLEPDTGKAESHRASLLEKRADMEQALSEYRKRLAGPEFQPFGRLEDAIAEYWNVLQPAVYWTGAARREHGYVFLRDEVFPRRTAMLGIADQIGAINEAQLNEGHLRVEQTFVDFRRRLMVAVALTVGLGLVLATFTTRKILSLENETEVRYREISEARSELGALSAKLVEAQEDERRSISRELHDEIGQALTGTLVEMANLSRLVRSGSLDQVQEKAEGIKKEIERSIGAVRNMALLLRPSMLDDLGLLPALQWQARESGKRSGLRVKVAAENMPDELPEEYNTCIYRVVQEALHNAVQHSGAQLVRVTVGRQDGRIALSIQDDGRGFDASHDRGLGILGMRERVNRLNGSLEIDSKEGAGTVVRAMLPLPAMEAGTDK